MTWHLIEGEAGCRYAVENNCVAVVVDALRASATAAMLFEAGATELLVVREVAEAREARKQWPDALLAGERGGSPPEGFDLGNSPRDLDVARGKRVIFTTTTGAGRLVSAWGAAAVYLGTTVNADAVIGAAAQQEKDVVLIPAGLATDPEFDAQEDWVAAAHLAQIAGMPLGEGRSASEAWRDRIADEGLASLFAAAPHAAKLRAVGLGDDVAYCARPNLSAAVPQGISRHPLGVRVRRAPTTARGSRPRSGLPRSPR